MGVVYKAEDRRLKRPVALKFPPIDPLASEEHKARFVPEAKAEARLDHQYICPVYVIDEPDGQTFIAMACLEGRTLKDKIAERPLELDVWRASLATRSPRRLGQTGQARRTEGRRSALAFVKEHTP